MSAEAQAGEADRNERMQKYIDGIISVTSFEGDGVEEPAKDGKAGAKKDASAAGADPALGAKKEPVPKAASASKDSGSTAAAAAVLTSVGSDESDSDDSSTYSIEIKRASPLISFASNGKKTRNKWRASEDFVLLRVLLDHAHLLTFVEYFKPMKKFWIKISQALNELHSSERNARQCHDRFKVLYSKAQRIQDDLDEDDTYSGTLNSEAEQLLLQVRNTFTFSSGNITLKTQPAVASAVSDETAQQAAATLRQDQDATTENNRKETETMQSYIFHVLSNLQEQIDLLRNHLRATDRKNQELSDTLQSLIQSFHFPPDGNNNDDISSGAANKDQP